jgi:hypothetical protein
MQPTAAMSPSLNFLTPRPSLTIRPTISWPGTHGYTVGMTVFHSSRTWCKSEWQTPQYKISIWTSCGRGVRRRTVNGAKPEVALLALKAFDVNDDGRGVSVAGASAASIFCSPI